MTIEKLKELQKTIYDLESDVYDAQEEWNSLADDLVRSTPPAQAIINDPEREEPEWIHGGHDCKSSPTEMCVYDEEYDPCYDVCIYCGAPSERK